MDSPYYLGGGSAVNFAPASNSAMKLATSSAGNSALKSYLMGMMTSGKSKAATPSSSQMDALNAGKGPVSASNASAMDQGNNAALAQLAGVSPQQSLYPTGAAGSSASSLKNNSY